MVWRSVRFAERNRPLRAGRLIVGKPCELQDRVRFGSKADICSAKRHVRSNPESGHVRFQLVGDHEIIWRDSEAERFGSCEVDDEINLACKLNRHIGGCRPFENPASVDAGTTIGIGLARGRRPRRSCEGGRKEDSG